MKQLLLLASLSSLAGAQQIVQTQTYSNTATGSGTDTLSVASQNAWSSGPFQPFNGRLGTLESFTIDWRATLSTSGVVDSATSGGFSSWIGGNFKINGIAYDGNGGGEGTVGDPGATLGPIDVAIDEAYTFEVAEAGSSYDPAILATVTGATGFNVTWEGDFPDLAEVYYDNMASISSSLTGTVTIVYDYTPFSYRSAGTIAGSGSAGSSDGTGTAASFNGPWGIAADALGNLYHLDYTGKRIRRTTPGGVVSFIDSFTSFPPIAAAIDPATGNLYVAIETHRILRYVNKNAANYPAQSPVYGPETDFPDSTIVYAGANSSGTTDATGTSARFNAPHGLHVRDGILYVADKGNNRIRKINLSNAAVSTVPVTGGTLEAPEGILVAADGTIYVACTGSDLIQKIAPNGSLSTLAGSVAGNLDGTGSAAAFRDPRGLAMNTRGELFVADSGNHTIRRVSPDGTVFTVAGGGTSGSFANGSGDAARFNSPRGVAFGTDGLLQVTDFGNHRIRLVNATQPRIMAASDSLAGFTAAGGTAGPSQSLTVTAEALAGELITVIAPAGYEVALDEGSYGTSLTINPEELPTTLHLRLAADATAGNATGNLVLTSAQAAEVTVHLSGRVLDITSSLTSLGGFSSVSGTPSASQTFEFRGNTGGNYTITAPPGFEVSLDGVNFDGSQTFAGVARLFSNERAIAALKTDGSVVTWGTDYGGNSSAVASQLSSGVSTITVNKQAFAALKSDGSVVTWGNVETGGNSETVASSLSSGVTAVYSNWNAFAALKNDGSVVTWGDAFKGGDSSAVAAQLSSGVVDVFPGGNAFAALKDDGSIVTWGPAGSGGNSGAVAEQLSTGVSTVVPSSHAFAAIKQNGSVVTWGWSEAGGDSSAVASQLASGVVSLFTTGYAFAALKDDGSVVTWGYSTKGGDSSAVASSLASGVSSIVSTGFAFAALKTDGSVVTWGNSYGGGDSSAVASSLAADVSSVSSNDYAFAALKTDGSVVTWGNEDFGGNSSAVADSLSSGVSSLHANPSGAVFAALKDDGSVVTWGLWAGDSSVVADRLASDVVSIHPAQYAFVAIKSDGSVVPWGGGSFNLSGSSLPAALPTGPPIVHVRLAADAPAGTLAGDLVITSGEVTQTVALSGTVAPGETRTHQEEWRFTNFGSYDSVASGADSADPDGDGLNNLLEYALGQNPNASGVLPAALALNGANLEYTYTRSTAAKDNGITYQIEWSDTLEAGSWSSEAVAEEIQGNEGALETVKASVPKGSGGKRFLRLRVIGPNGNP